jgi:tripartite-type tricarboxylate transporter receptor subunit TctC
MKFPRRQFLHLAAGAAALPAVSRAAWAQPYPTRPIRLLVPFPPGGAFDTIGRPWADKMKAVLGTVIVENQGGASGSLAAATVAHARPDGYTILLGASSIHLIELILKSRPLYDPIKDLQPITILAINAFAIAVHPSVPARTVKDLIDYARANPGKVSYGTTGVGSLQHLAGELLKSLTGGPDIVHVPYRGAGPATADLLAGQVPMVILCTTAAGKGKRSRIQEGLDEPKRHVFPRAVACQLLDWSCWASPSRASVRSAAAVFARASFASRAILGRDAL